MSKIYSEQEGSDFLRVHLRTLKNYLSVVKNKDEINGLVKLEGQYFFTQDSLIELQKQAKTILKKQKDLRREIRETKKKELFGVCPKCGGKLNTVDRDEQACWKCYSFYLNGFEVIYNTSTGGTEYVVES